MSFDRNAQKQIASMTRDYRRRLSVNVNPDRTPPSRDFVLDIFWAKVTASAEITTGERQYTYTCVEQQRTPTGSLSPWRDMPGGRTVTAHSAAEAFNASGATVQGNGIDHGDAGYPAADWFLPLRGNVVVMVLGQACSDGSYVYTILTVPNAEQGAC